MNPMTLFKLFFKPTAGWESLMASQPSMHRLFLLHVLPFAMIPPVMIYFVGKSRTILFFDLLPGSKLILVSLILFFVQLVVVPVMASIIRQLAEIADSHPTYRESFILAAVAPTPLWMAPVFLVVPDIIINIGITSLAMMASAGFIYYGIPTVFKIKEQGHVHLLFGAVLMAGATAWGFLMISTFVIWGSVQNLQFAVGPAAG
jgi:hypothetical protein